MAKKAYRSVVVRVRGSNACFVYPPYYSEVLIETPNEEYLLVDVFEGVVTRIKSKEKLFSALADFIREEVDSLEDMNPYGKLSAAEQLCCEELHRKLMEECIARHCKGMDKDNPRYLDCEDECFEEVENSDEYQDCVMGGGDPSCCDEIQDKDLREECKLAWERAEGVLEPLGVMESLVEDLEKGQVSFEIIDARKYKEGKCYRYKSCPFECANERGGCVFLSIG